MKQMTIDQITEPGYYWSRIDEYRDWGIVYLKRQMLNPEHPRHNLFEVCGTPAESPNARCSYDGMGFFIGPLALPD